MVWAVKKFHSYIWGAEVKVVTDHHALFWLITKKDQAGRLARWALSVQVYQPQIVYKSGRLHEDADALSRYPVTIRYLKIRIRRSNDAVLHWNVEHFWKYSLNINTIVKRC